jgi:adenylate cyclase
MASSGEQATQAQEVDFEREGLLQGVEPAQRADRLALLQELLAEGVGLSELRRYSAEGTVMFLPAERVIGGSERYTAAQLIELTGADPAFLLTARRAMGLPVPEDGEPAYVRADLEALRMAQVAKAAGIGEEEIFGLMRTLGRGLSQAAESMRAVVLRLVLEPGVSEHDLARRYAEAAGQLAPMMGPLVGNLLTLHLRQMAESEVISAAERSGGDLPGSRQMAVCFADLVGFTRLGEELEPQELGRLAVRLEALAVEAVKPPVRLVKTIGDAAMLVSPEPEPLLEATFSLLDAAHAEGEQFPRVRAGMALGSALSHAGDWFGRPVNLASRITAVARPGSVLAERRVSEAVGERYRFSYAGERRLHGVRGAVRLYRARRHQDE